MSVSPDLQTRLKTVFGRLNQVSADSAFSQPSTLSESLGRLIPDISIPSIYVDQKIATVFATASVDIWLRGVHSFLVSASLTKASPIWASVSGYYASHYSVRALAHLLGYFLLFSKKRIVQLSYENGRYCCSFARRAGGDREHKLYWRRVSADSHFREDPFFRQSDLTEDASDVRHRDHANYADSLFPYPNFRVLDEALLRNRIRMISRIEITDPPVPRLSEFPDLDSVQLIAYHRIVRYRQFLDEVLPSDNRFWKVHRNPTFASSMLNFQATQPSGLGALAPK